MNSRQFAHAWLEREGLFDKDSDYEGWLGRCVMDVWNFIADQEHSGMSAAFLFSCLTSIHNAYMSTDHPIWQEYWQSDEGKALMDSMMHGGIKEEPIEDAAATTTTQTKESPARTGD